jgi:hypothetical protein
MAGRIRLLMVAVCCVLSAGFNRSAAQAQAAQSRASRTYYSFCYSEPLIEGAASTTYFSAIFHTPDVRLAIVPPSADPLTRGRPDGSVTSPGRVAWARDFDEFLVQKNSFPASIPVNCESDFTTEQQAQERRTKAMDAERTIKRSVADTGWKFSYTPGQPIPGAVPCYAPPAQHRISTTRPGCNADGTLAASAPAAVAAPTPRVAPPAPAVPAPASVEPRAAKPPTPPRRPAPPPAAAVVSPPAQKYGLCFARTFVPNRTAYFSSPFGPAKVANRAWQEAFKDFLSSKYHFTGPTNCVTEASEAEVQNYEQRTKEGLRSKGKWDIVDTGWKFQ